MDNELRQRKLPDTEPTGQPSGSKLLHDLDDKKKQEPLHSQEHSPVTWKDGLVAVALAAMAFPIRINSLDDPPQVMQVRPMHTVLFF